MATKARHRPTRAGLRRCRQFQASARRRPPAFRSTRHWARPRRPRLGVGAARPQIAGVDVEPTAIEHVLAAVVQPQAVVCVEEPDVRPHGRLAHGAQRDRDRRQRLRVRVRVRACMRGDERWLVPERSRGGHGQAMAAGRVGATPTNGAPAAPGWLPAHPGAAPCTHPATPSNGPWMRPRSNAPWPT